MATEKYPLVFQFLVCLKDIEPPVWRRIQVPAQQSFWDLHVAIQDAMGWFDFHLHSFFKATTGGRPDVMIGIPNENFTMGPTFIPGWETPLTSTFDTPGQELLYEYDFGDSWLHSILFEAIMIREKGTRYPRCVGGERACPPEDCGGVPGYDRMLHILKHPKHPEYEDTVTWLYSLAKQYQNFDPEAFDPTTVRFSNANTRLKKLFSGGQ